MPSDLDQLRNIAAEARKALPAVTVLRTQLKDIERAEKAVAKFASSNATSIIREDLYDAAAHLTTVINEINAAKTALTALVKARSVPS